MRGKNCHSPLNRSGGSGSGGRGSKFCCNFLSTHRFYGKSKEFGYPYRFGPQVVISKGYPRTPHVDFGFWDGFWGLEGATGVRLQCFWSQKNGIYAHKQMQPKNNFFPTPIFQGSWFSILGPWGSLGSNGPDLTILNYLLTPLIPKVRHVVYCKYAYIYKIQRWGSGDRAPYPDLGSNPFQNVGLI